MRPAVRLLTAAANALLRALGVEPRSELEAASVEDVADMVELAGREGAIDRADRELLDRAIRFAGMEVEQVIVPWDQVTSVEESMSLTEMKQVAIGAGHSRLPVLSHGEVLGFVPRARPPAASSRAALAASPPSATVSPIDGAVRGSSPPEPPPGSCD
jgi:CBS domain containing-hemolysin-like protein